MNTRVDFALTTTSVTIGLAVTAFFVAGLYAASTTVIGIAVGIMLGIGYEAKKQG